MVGPLVGGLHEQAMEDSLGAFVLVRTSGSAPPTTPSPGRTMPSTS